MAVTPENVEKANKTLRAWIPADFGRSPVKVAQTFAVDFSAMRPQLLSSLGDSIESALSNIRPEADDRFLDGWIDGAIATMALLATIQIEN